MSCWDSTPWLRTLPGIPYFGALIGRYGNRIAKARFRLNGKEYVLAANDGRNHLHGGIVGFDKVVWNASEIQNGGTSGLRLTYHSKDGEEGYPGNLDCTVTYSFNDRDELSIDYTATTDRPTVINLTHHSYFNLKGAGSGDILDHHMMIRADKYTPADLESIPTGELRAVAGSAMDFTQPRIIGSRIQEVTGGYDHNYVLAEKAPRALSLAAVVTAPDNGRKMEVLTTEPGIQFYSGNYLDGTIKGKGGKIYTKHGGFCLETQHFPDLPNQPAFPSTVLKSRRNIPPADHLQIYRLILLAIQAGGAQITNRRRWGCPEIGRMVVLGDTFPLFWSSFPRQPPEQ